MGAWPARLLSRRVRRKKNKTRKNQRIKHPPRSPQHPDPFSPIPNPIRFGNPAILICAGAFTGLAEAFRTRGHRAYPPRLQSDRARSDARVHAAVPQHSEGVEAGHVWAVRWGRNGAGAGRGRRSSTVGFCGVGW